MTVIHIDYSPVHELATSLFAYQDRKNQLHDLGNKWRKQMEKHLSDSFDARLDQLQFCDHISFLHLLILDSPAKHEIDAYLNWMAELGEGELYERLSPYLEEGPGMSIGLKAFRDGSVDVLREWQQACHISDHILGSLQRSAARVEELSRTLSYPDLIDAATSGVVLDLEEELEFILLIPAYHIKPLNRIDIMNDKQLVVSYAVDDEQMNEDTPTSQMLRMIKSLADEKRLILLHILAAGPVTFTELQQKTKLSKSNLHYHLSLLKTAGLLRMHLKKQGERYKYSARPESFDSLRDMLESYVFGLNRDK
ncbi:winged helix-turn-helix transcriptional regulator [Paenibacillus sp. F411]|uniref:ArsR/SmtB family transcription factor n=1 Tax=Paenibacillus sp. F411 TaxID=2820239 RepID=UPI001AAEC2F2|nr:winged helix-turn-helix domain-containing protein [Paenibacillus sp. F411]MBO2944074.1 winged helix-turn-helix transcriptional regulator [Paenibacillus sp. F411]